MQNQRVAYLLMRTARLLEIKGENVYKVRAYQKAARAIAHMDEDIGVLHSEGLLQAIPGVGRHLAGLIAEIITTDNLACLNELELEVPPELAELASLPGVGVKTIKALFQNTTIRTPLELEHAIRDKSLLGVPGLGNQAIQRIRRVLEKWGAQGKSIDLGMAIPLSEYLLLLVQKTPYVEQACIVGQLRRGLELVNQIEILAATAQTGEVIHFFQQLPLIREVIESSATHCRVKVELGIVVELRAVDIDLYAIEQVKQTGSIIHVDGLTALAVQQGHIIRTEEWPSWLQALGVITETDVYHAHQLAFIPPEIREGTRALTVEPKEFNLITLPDIKGDLHMHTAWSDGYHSIEKMAQEAKSLGYEYIAICDHSQSLSIAGGLSERRLKQQRLEIEALNERELGIRILSGIELDILPDRRLDYADEILRDLDIVIGSIHSGFKQDAATITARIETAMKNEHVDIIAHPTGRMLRRRSGYQFEPEKIFPMAVKTGTLLEINASPDRLDLRDVHVQQAQAYGCKFVINTDAHDAKHLTDMRYGVINARRGWLQTENVINSMGYTALQKHLHLERHFSEKRR
jgi:DNA polymerase (family 10)